MNVISLKQSLLSGSVSKEAIRYIFAGGAATVVDIAVLMFLIELGVNWLYSACAGFFFGSLANYFLCIYFVFDFRRISNQIHELLIYLIFSLFGLLIYISLMFVFIEMLGFAPLLVKIFVAIVCCIINFSMRKLIAHSILAA